MEEIVPVEADAQDIELGKWMGRREAFGLIAGRCSAAEIESLQKIRDGKLYQRLNDTWEDFCLRQLRVSKRTVDRDIAFLRRFGPAFFTLRQLARITVREYTAVAGQVSEDGVHVDGALVPLLPENSEALAQALKTLLERNSQAAAIAPPPPGFETVLERFRTAAQGLRSFEGKLDHQQLRELASQLAEILSAAAGCGVSVAVQ